MEISVVNNNAPLKAELYGALFMNAGEKALTVLKTASNAVSKCFSAPVAAV